MLLSPIKCQTIVILSDNIVYNGNNMSTGLDKARLLDTLKYSIQQQNNITKLDVNHYVYKDINLRVLA